MTILRCLLIGLVGLIAAVLPQAQRDLAFVPQTQAQIFTSNPLRAISNRFQTVGSKTTEQSSFVRGEGRIQFKTAPCTATNVRVIIGGFNRNLVGGLVVDKVNLATVTHELVLEYGGTAYRFTWAGANTKDVPPGLQIYLSDPIAGLSTTPDSTGFMRFNVTGASWPEGAIANIFSPSLLFQYYISNAVSTQVFGTGVLSLPSGGQQPQSAWAPIGLVGNGCNSMSFVVVGHSEIDWQNDGGGDGNGNISYARRALWSVNGHMIPSIKLSRGNDSFSQWNAASAGSRLLYSNATHAFIDLAANDFGGNNLAQLLALAQPTWATMKAAGLRVFQATTVPQTNAANTVIAGSAFQPGGIRDQWNTQLAAELLAGRIDGILDPNPCVESQSSHGFWKDGTMASTDGVHMDPPGHSAGAGCVAANLATMNFLLRRDVHRDNDNSPMWLARMA